MRERLGIALLVAFVALDLVLVALAFRHTSASPPAAPSSSATKAPSVGAGSDAPASTVPSSAARTSTPSALSPPSGAANHHRSGTAMLAVTGDGTVVRVTGGSCDKSGRPVVDVSKKQGRHLSSGSVDGLSQALRVIATSDEDLTIVGLDRDCRVATFTSSDGGDSWSSRDGGAGTWYLSPAARKPVVFSPSGRRRASCPTQSVAPVDNSVARLLCKDGTVSGTSDSALSWVTLGRLDGGRDMAFQTPGDGFAVAVQNDCESALMRTRDGGTSWREESCLKGGAPRAVAVAGDTVVAQVGERLLMSTDAGKTWRRVHT